MIADSYSLALVILSIAVAVIGAYVAVETAQRVRASEGRRRTRWINAGALALALGIWSMHFVGMLALQPSVPTWYDVLLIVASIIAAVVAAGIAFYIFNRATVRFPMLALAGILMGVAIAGMYYTGMAGMRTGGSIIYDPRILAASVGIAVVFSFVALWGIRKVLDLPPERRSFVRRAGAALLLAAPFVGMQYAGMAAAQFTRGTLGWQPGDGLFLGTFQVGLILSIVSIILLMSAWGVTRFERWSIATRTKFESLLQLSPQIVWFAQPDGQISYFNPYWYDYTGLSERATLGYAWTEAIHPEDRDRVIWSWQQAAKEGHEYDVEMRLRNNDGTYCWFLARSRPGRDEAGNVNAWLGIAVDIEERKKAEEEAWAASQAKSEFLASMSHELRTPLNAIGGYAELLAMGIRGSLNAEQAQDVARIRRSQQHLLTLINDVLNFAKVDAGQAEYRLTAVPVDEILKDTESMIAPQILAKGLRYTYKGGDKTASVLADPEKLQQIVLNLLSNAVKFTDVGGSLILAATPSGNCIEISVADTGAGISPEKVNRVFDPFVQAERRLNQPVQGVGLGLAISRDLARAMNGDITVESTFGKGSTFTLSLPRAPRVNPADIAAATESARIRAAAEESSKATASDETAPPESGHDDAPQSESGSADRSLQEASPS
ncbi:MAG TPA: MHYT domain-containing protein [Gemmatimonadaceae bacterium]|jgi:PAS domain S-box-containing protein|nr:MHYT domain-containing protein [Gemmatimonadaceae bacterium]